MIAVCPHWGRIPLVIKTCNGFQTYPMTIQVMVYFDTSLV